MDFIEGSRGLYKPIKVMFNTPIYERAVQTCWHIGSYKCQIALLTELLRLQQNNQLPSAVTVEDITEFLVEESKSTLRVQLWEFELEDYAADVRPLLKLAWKVNTSMKMRDVEFEARRLLSSPEKAPPQFQHPKIIGEAHLYARRLTEQQQEPRGPKQLSPQEVVMEVVPKVLQGFWLPPPSSFLNMISQQLCTMAVGVTKAVEDRVSTALSSMLCQVPFTRSTRDYLVLSIQEKVRQGQNQDILVKKLNCFAAEVLNTITDVAAVEISSLFQPQAHASVTSIPEQQPQSSLKPDSAVVSPPSSPLTSLAEPPANTGFSEEAEQPTTRLEEKSVVSPTPPSPMSPPAVMIPSVMDPEHTMEEPTKGQDSTAVPAPTPPIIPPAEVSSSVLDSDIKNKDPTRDEDSVVVPNPPPPVNPVDEPPVNAANQEEMTFSEVEPVQQPIPSPEPDFTPPAALNPTSENAANNGMDEAEEESVPISEPNSAGISTFPTSPPAIVIPAVLDPEHTMEEPTRDEDAVVVPNPPPPVNPVDEPPVNAANQEEMTFSEVEPVQQPKPSPEPDFTPPAALNPTSENAANHGMDEAEEESVPSSESNSAVAPTPPPPVNHTAANTTVALTKKTMEFIEGSRGLYKPIKVMFNTPIYERAVQTCWHIGSYKCQIALLTELLRLQQNNQLPSAVTVEDITEFLVEESKSTLRVQLWEFELEDYAADVRPLLKLAWKVNTSMKMRDVEFEARRLLSSPEKAPPQFQHPKIIGEAHLYARRLTEQQQEPRGPKQLSPQEVVMEVVPKVLQGFWLPPPSSFLNMISQQLCTMAVGVTKAVEDRVSTALSSMLCQVPFTRSTRDYLVLSIQEKVRQGQNQDILVKKLNCFAAEVLNTITDVAAVEISSLFQPQAHTSVTSIPEQQPQSSLKPDSAVVSPPSSPLTSLAEPPANTGFSEEAEQPTTRLEEKSVVSPTPPSPMSPPAVVISAVMDPEHTMEKPTKGQDSTAVPAPTPPIIPPAEVSSSVLDSEIKNKDPTRDEDSVVVPNPPPPVNPVDEPPVNAANQEEMTFSEVEPVQQPIPSPEPDFTPPAALNPTSENAANNGMDEAEEESVPISEPNSAGISTFPTSPPAIVIPAVLDPEHTMEEPTRDEDAVVVPNPPPPVNPVDEPPVNAANQEEMTFSEVEPVQQPIPSPEPDFTPPAALNPTSENAANNGMDEAEEESVPISEPNSAGISTFPTSPPAIVIPAVLDPEHTMEEPTRDEDAVVVPNPPPPVNPVDEPPVNAANQEEMTFTEVESMQQPIPSPEPDFTPSAPFNPTSENAANYGMDEAEEESVPSSEPNSAVAPTPPPPVNHTAANATVALTKKTMEFIEGSRGLYKPIKVMFNTPIYERAVQTCWHIGSYKCQIALLTELLRLQQNNQLPSAVTVEDITEFLVEESKSTLRVQLWEFELEDYAADVRPLLKLAWKVNTSMKMRDVEFEARRLLSSPEKAPPQFQHPKIIGEAHLYARRLTEQQQEPRGPKQLSPQEVVMEVVPKVLQGFWLPPPNSFLNMISQQLCTMAVGVTKAVEDRVSTALSSMLCQVPFTRSTRDYLVLSIQEKVRQGQNQDILVKKLNCFAAEVLNTITDVAAVEISSLFQPQAHASVTSIPEQQPQSSLKPDSAVVSPPSSPLTSLAEPPANTGFSEEAEQPTTRLEEKSVVSPTPPSPMSPPAVVIPAVMDPEHTMEEPTKGQDSTAAPAPTPPIIPPAEVSSSVLDFDIKNKDPTRDEDSVVVPNPPPPVNPVDEPPVNAANQEEITFSEVEPMQQPIPSPEPDFTPPAALNPTSENAANNGMDEAEEESVPISEPNSAGISTFPTSPPAIVIPAVLDPEHTMEEPTRDEDAVVVPNPPPPVNPVDEPPINAANQEEMTFSEVEPVQQPKPSPEPDFTPSAPFNPTSNSAANHGMDEAEEESVPSSEPNSAVVSTPPLPTSPPAVAIPAVLDPEHTMEEPTRDKDSVVVPTPPPPLNPVDEPPVNAANQEEMTFSEVEPVQQPKPSPEPDFTPPAPLNPTSENAANNVMDEAEEESVPISEPNSAGISTPPLPTSPPAVVIPAVMDPEHTMEEPTRDEDSVVVPTPPPPLNPIDEPPVNAANQEEMTFSEVEPVQQPITGPEPDFTPSAPFNPPSNSAANHGMDEAEEESVPSSEPNSAVVSTPPLPTSPPAVAIPAVLDPEHTMEEPTRDKDSVVVPTPPPPLNTVDEPPVNAANQEEMTFSEVEPVQQPKPSPEPGFTPPTPLNPTSENAANNVMDEAEEESVPISEPNSAVISTPPLPTSPPAVVIPAVMDPEHTMEEPTRDEDSVVVPTPPPPLNPVDEPPVNAANQEEMTFSEVEPVQQPKPSPEPDFTPSAPFNPTSNSPANHGMDEAEEESLPISEPNSAVISTFPTSPPAIVIPAVLDPEHTMEEPTRDEDAVVVPNPPPPLNPVDEPPVNAANQEEITFSEVEPVQQPKPSPEPDFTPPAPLNPTSENAANHGMDEAEEESVPSSELNSVVVPTPPSPVNHTAANQEVMKFIEVEPVQLPTPNPDPDYTPPAPLNPTVIITPQPLMSPPAKIILSVLDPTKEPYSAVATTPPPLLTPADALPVTTPAQNDLIIIEQPVIVDEPLCITTEIKKKKMDGFRRVFKWLRRNICCCCLPEEDAEME